MVQRVSIASSRQDLADNVDCAAIMDIFTVIRYPQTGPRLRPNGRIE
jgi:hypothetical protein